MTGNGGFFRRAARATAGIALAILAGCSTFQPPNVGITEIDESRGYRAATVAAQRPIGDIAFMLAFSGGGTRAAALAYGVLLELRDTMITGRHGEIRLLDEIDSISSVSGGSFTSAYYGLYGDRIFDDFEERFLKSNVEDGLLASTFLPQNFFRLIGSGTTRTDLAVEYYDKTIFDGKTFTDLQSAGGPLIQINSTNIGAGARFTFIQDQFDIICSDLSEIKVARAVTASSAVPVAFAPVVLKNRAGQCGYELSETMQRALTERQQSPRKFRIAKDTAGYDDAESLPYLHLLDGGIADNLGVRGTLDRIMLDGGIWHEMEILNEDAPGHVVFLVLDASTEPRHAFVSFPGAPSLSALIGSISGTEIHRFNYETKDLLAERTRAWVREVHGENMRAMVIDLAEYRLDDEDRAFFDSVPTSLTLPDATVDRLISLGRKMLRSSDEYTALLRALGGRRIGTETVQAVP